MKSFFTYFVLIFLLFIGALISERALGLLKEMGYFFKTQPAKLGFYYGWVDCNNKRTFFIQENFFVLKNLANQTDLKKQIHQQIHSKLKAQFKSFKILEIQQISNLETVLDVQLQKRRLSKSQFPILALPIPLKKEIGG